MAALELPPASQPLESLLPVRPVMTRHMQQDSLRSQLKEVLGRPPVFGLLGYVE